CRVPVVNSPTANRNSHATLVADLFHQPPWAELSAPSAFSIPPALIGPNSLTTDNTSAINPSLACATFQYLTRSVSEYRMRHRSHVHSWIGYWLGSHAQYSTITRVLLELC